MDDLQLLIDLHITADRQGPGGEAETRRAIELSGLSNRRNLKVADIGCGTGASTLVLAKDLDAQIVAVDFLPEFLDVLRSRAARAGVADSIETVNASMDELPIEPGSLDAIWSVMLRFCPGLVAATLAIPFRDNDSPSAAVLAAVV